jgi:hypothetical protein
VFAPITKLSIIGATRTGHKNKMKRTPVELYRFPAPRFIVWLKRHFHNRRLRLRPGLEMAFQVSGTPEVMRMQAVRSAPILLDAMGTIMHLRNAQAQHAQDLYPSLRKGKIIWAAIHLGAQREKKGTPLHASNYVDQGGNQMIRSSNSSTVNFLMFASPGISSRHNTVSVQGTCLSYEPITTSAGGSSIESVPDTRSEPDAQDQQSNTFKSFVPPVEYRDKRLFPAKQAPHPTSAVASRGLVPFNKPQPTRVLSAG